MSANELEMKIAQLQEWEAIAAEANAEAKALKDEITAEMVSRDVEEMTVGRFICRFTSVLSSRFDTKRFKEVFGEDVYQAFTKEVPSRRFSISA